MRLNVNTEETNMGSMPPRPKLLLPKTPEQIGKIRSDAGYQSFPEGIQETTAARDGMYLRSNVELDSEDISKLTRACLESLISVKDTHFPEFSVIDCGFLREFWLDVDGNTGAVKVHIWYMFTSAACPTGSSMTQASEPFAHHALTELGVPEVEVTCGLGGTEWQAEDAFGLARQFFEETIARNMALVNSSDEVVSINGSESLANMPLPDAAKLKI